MLLPGAPAELRLRHVQLPAMATFGNLDYVEHFLRENGDAVAFPPEQVLAATASKFRDHLVRHTLSTRNARLRAVQESAVLSS